MTNEIYNQNQKPETLEQVKAALGQLNDGEKAQLGEELCVQLVSLRQTNPALYQGIVDTLQNEQKTLERQETPESSSRLGSLKKLFSLITSK